MIAFSAKQALPLAAAIMLAVAAGAPALAQSCGTEIEQLAQRYNLPPETARGAAAEPSAPAHPPPAGGIGAAQQRAQSSGASSPADTDAVAPIQPAPADPARAAAPPGSAVAGSTTGSPELGAADRARMAWLLDAARAAERQGKDADCLARLREAAAVPHAPSAK